MIKRNDMKKIKLFSAAVLLSAALASCGNESGNEGMPYNIKTVNEDHDSVWHSRDNFPSKDAGSLPAQPIPRDTGEVDVNSPAGDRNHLNSDN